MMTSKSKTFQKGDDYGDLVEWFMNQIEVNEYQPEGTEWSGGEPGPFDPVCELNQKYVITVKKIECDHKNETIRQGDGFVYVICSDCGESLNINR